MFPTILHLGPFTLHTYGLLVAAGFLVAMSVLRRTIWTAGVDPKEVDGFSVQLLLSGILGARIMFFAVDGFLALRSDPLAFFRVWEGGLVFYGGVAGALVAAFIFARRRQVRFLALCDALVPPLLIGHALGRLGCLAAGCCYGRRADGWPGIVFNHPESLAPRGIPLLPTQPLEAAVLAGLFAVSYALFRRGVAVGRLTAFYLCGYAVLRFFMEFMRGDDRGAYVLGLSPSQAVALVMFAAGIGVFFYGQRIKNR